MANDTPARTTTTQCDESVWERPGYWHSHQCTRRATIVIAKDGVRREVCTQHGKWLTRNGWQPVSA
jgi:hypothetical protein